MRLADDLDRLVASLEAAPGVDAVIVSLSHDQHGIVLHRIEIDPAFRGRGIGTAVMEVLIAFADSAGLAIALTPEGRRGTPKAALVRWYRSLGFVPNKGRNKSFRYQEALIRWPT